MAPKALQLPIMAADIIRILPHGIPDVYVDRILELKLGESVVGLKNVTINESWADTHFRGDPTMPGHLMLEAISQVGAILLLVDPKNKGKTPRIGSLAKVKFRRKVVPGDQLRIDVSLDKTKGDIGRGTAKATVDGELACEGEFTYILT